MKIQERVYKCRRCNTIKTRAYYPTAPCPLRTCGSTSYKWDKTMDWLPSKELMFRR